MSVGKHFVLRQRPDVFPLPEIPTGVLSNIVIDIRWTVARGSGLRRRVVIKRRVEF
jgi:hypothetical protein